MAQNSREHSESIMAKIRDRGDQRTIVSLSTFLETMESVLKVTNHRSKDVFEYRMLSVMYEMAFEVLNAVFRDEGDQFFYLGTYRSPRTDRLPTNEIPL
ncbi:hypothetical protein [Solidesulfovibrio sp.]|uniref:hypothetical protein n=1 Tax=Solidesulfovibrio sp. TaxID=2910990 RepID=UPI002B20ECB1|nr:hypothetical protein [Solidesulfovibrio sp.]MEA4856152.1 hypothetical protein [Solidesulfovibrio sp.]